MILVDALVENFEPPSPGFATIRLSMTSEDRARVRRRIVAPDGHELALALPTGTKLWPGQVLYRTDDTVYVVEAAPEKVIVIKPLNAREAAKAGHLVGNMHRDIDLEGEGIAVLFDEVLEDRLLREDFTLEHDERPFHGNAGGGHAH